RLVVAGLPLRLEPLTSGRSHRILDLEDLPAGADAEPATPSTWLVNGSRARPLGAPEPNRLGTGPVLPRPEPESRSPAAPHDPAGPSSPTPSQRPDVNAYAHSNAFLTDGPAGARSHGIATTRPNSLVNRIIKSDSHTAMKPPPAPPTPADRVMES